MNVHLDAERILDAYLAPEADRLPDRVLDAALADVARTPQRRALRVPWRFPTMPALTRATGIAAVALVAVVGAGGITYFAAGGPGPSPTPPPTPAPTSAPTVAPTVAPTPAPSYVAMGITGWKTYTSSVYGFTISYPEDWVIGGRATQEWKPDESEDAPSKDVLFNNQTQAVPDHSMIIEALQFPGPAGADLGSWDGLLDALTEMCARPTEFYRTTCPSEDSVTRMCLGTECQPVAFVLKDRFPRAIFGDPETGTVTYIWVARVDDFPGAAPYGGTVKLLKAVLGELDIREPQPGETPN
jgi:hypothetical protein